MALRNIVALLVFAGMLSMMFSACSGERETDGRGSPNGNGPMNSDVTLLLDETATYEERLAVIRELAAQDDKRAVVILNQFVEQYRQSDVLTLESVKVLGNLGDQSSIAPLQNMIAEPPKNGDYWNGKIVAATDAAIDQCSE